MNTTQLETLLRQAPQPKPPGNLRQRLVAQALNAPRLIQPAAPRAPKPGSWLARWWPALAPGVVSLACAGILTLQHLEIRQSEATLQATAQHSAVTAAQPKRPADSGVPGAFGKKEQEELTRLRGLAASLGAEVSKLEQMRGENEKLRSQLTQNSAGAFTSDETAALERARARALSIQCVNNLKQLGLAAKVWALDNGDMTPPDFLSMSNELGSFKILVCPADTGRQPARDAASFSPANCSYLYLAPSSPETEPDRVMFRCPIHGHIGLCDGSVQSEIAKNHPDWIVQRDGKSYLKRVEAPPALGGSAPGPTAPGQSR